MTISKFEFAGNNNAPIEGDIPAEPYEVRSMIDYKNRGFKDIYTVEKTNDDFSVDLKVHLNNLDLKDRQVVFDILKGFLSAFSSTVYEVCRNRGQEETKG